MRGVLTIAIGRRYRDMALSLARSLWLFNPNERIAIVTDDCDQFSSLVGPLIIVPYNASFGTGVRQKMHLDYYTPFEQTLFIDSDCLVFGSLKNIWEDCAKVNFGVFGDDITDLRSWWYFKEASATFLAKFPKIPRFNGGLYYFLKNMEAAAVFSQARNFAEEYSKSGLASFRSEVPDEPCYAVAFGRLGLSALSNSVGRFATPDEFGFCSVKADVLRGQMTYKKNGMERIVTVAHFFGGWTGTYLYQIETFRLKFNSGILKAIIPPAAKLFGDVSYSTFLFLRKIILRLLRPNAAPLPAGLPVIPLLNFAQKVRSLFRKIGN